jgi:hypothetical protein
VVEIVLALSLDINGNAGASRRVKGAGEHDVSFLTHDVEVEKA